MDVERPCPSTTHFEEIGQTSRCSETTRMKRDKNSRHRGPMNPSERIDEVIAELGDWRGKTIAGIRKIILGADRNIMAEAKWKGKPKWAARGMKDDAEA